MSQNSDQAWKKLTSTVGLITTLDQRGVNVMSAEWSYFVNKDPLYVSVVLSPHADTRPALESSGEFGLTLCSAGQAALADFAGSFSTADVDKSASELIDFGQPVTTATPWVRGGVLALECELRQTVDLPGHRMYIAEAVATHRPAEDCLPLVKHGGMFQIGDPAQRACVVAAARVLPGNVLRVAATGPAAEHDEWHVWLLPPDRTEIDLGAHPSAAHGDFLADLPLPTSPDAWSGARIRVERPGAQPGYATLDFLSHG